MESVKRIVHQNEHRFKPLLFASIGLAAFNTLARADYNLIIYIYIYYVWTVMTDSKEVQASEKSNSFLVLLFSLIIDILWVTFWSSHWSIIKNDSESFVHSLVILSSWIAILVKV